MDRARHSGQFKKGDDPRRVAGGARMGSGQKSAEFKEKCAEWSRLHGFEYLTHVVMSADTKTYHVSEKLKALELLLYYGLGKPVEYIKTEEVNEFRGLDDKTLLEMAAKYLKDNGITDVKAFIELKKSEGEKMVVGEAVEIKDEIKPLLPAAGESPITVRDVPEISHDF